jgi:carbamoyl-phosphate synthase small subunit
MQTATPTRTPTPAAPPRPASFSYRRPAHPSVDPAPGLLALEGGTVHRGVLRGAPVPAEGDLIFTTAATGWGEILTDPSYAGQIVVLTHPMAGNYRIDASELESARVRARALVVSRLVDPPAGPGWSLDELLRAAGVPAITGVDTRAITLELRRGAARRAVIRLATTSDDEAVAEAKASPSWESVDHVAAVATREAYDVPGRPRPRHPGPAPGRGRA